MPSQTGKQDNKYGPKLQKPFIGKHLINGLYYDYIGTNKKDGVPHKFYWRPCDTETLEVKFFKNSCYAKIVEVTPTNKYFYWWDV